VRLAGAGLAVLVALPTACGGHEAEALTKAQYVSSLNAMCRDFSEREKAFGEPQSIEDLAQKGPKVLDAFQKAIVDKVHELKAPREIARQADRFADLADEQNDVLRGLVEAAKRSDFASIPELSAKNTRLNREAGEIASELGANACAKNES
jgi:hypothetical protein